jgi:ABC-type nitrate/sulfonate/bicarbonate transport system substrate-binding protein
MLCDRRTAAYGANGGEIVSLAVRFVTLLMLAPLIVCVNAVAQGKPEKEKIRIGYAARAVTHSIPYLANEAGLFRDEGLQVEVVLLPAPSRRWLSFRAIRISPPCRPFS